MAFLPTVTLAQVRTTKLNCETTDSKGNEVVLKIERNVEYVGTSIEVSLGFSLRVKGTFEEETGSLAGGARLTNLEPNQASANRSIFNVSDGRGNMAAMNPLSEYLKDKDMPGSALTVQVRTENDDIPFLVLKGVIGSFRAGTKGQILNANLFVSNRKASTPLTNTNLSCSYTMTE